MIFITMDGIKKGLTINLNLYQPSVVNYQLGRSKNKCNTNFKATDLRSAERLNQSGVNEPNGLIQRVVKFVVKLCEPGKHRLNSIFRNLRWLENWDFGGDDSFDDYITDVLRVLRIHSKNPEFSKFAEDGINFFRNNKYNLDLYYRDSVIEGLNNHYLDTGGVDLRFTICEAYEKAIKPNSKINEATLRELITKAREYMDAFTERGEHIYPEGFVYPDRMASY